MKTHLEWHTSSASANETEQLAEKLGQALTGGEVIELTSDLGGGKTVFVRGLAKGMGSVDKVVSPTYTISREYYSPDLTLYHFDFYRLHEPGVMQHELSEAIHKREAVVVIEWADIVQGVLPRNRLTIQLKPTGETTRQISFTAPKDLSYLIRAVQS